MKRAIFITVWSVSLTAASPTNPRPYGPRFGFSEGLAAVKVGGKVAYCDYEGKLVIQPKFVSGGAFSCGLASVMTSDGRWGYVDRSGTMVIPPSSGLTGEEFVDNRALFTNKELWGYIDLRGKIAIPAQFTFAHSFSEGVAAVRDQNQWLFIEPSGRTALRPPMALAYAPFHEGLAGFWPVEKPDRYGFIDRNGKVVITPTLVPGPAGYIGPFFSEGLAAARKDDDLWGFIDRTGRFVIPPQFDDVFEFIDGVARVWLRGKYGFIDHQGRFVIPPRFDHAGVFGNGLAPADLGKETGYVDKTGKFVIRTKMAIEYLGDFSEGHALIQRPDGGYGVMDTKGRIFWGKVN